MTEKPTDGALDNIEEGKGMKPLFSWLLKSKNKAVGSGGVIAIYLLLQSNITDEIQTAEASAKAYADSKHAIVETDIKSIKETQAQMLRMLEIIDRRVYNMNKNKLDVVDE